MRLLTAFRAAKADARAQAATRGHLLIPFTTMLESDVHRLGVSRCTRCRMPCRVQVHCATGIWLGGEALTLPCAKPEILPSPGDLRRAIVAMCESGEGSR